jgi:hypothetical protein
LRVVNGNGQIFDFDGKTSFKCIDESSENGRENTFLLRGTETEFFCWRHRM